MLSRLPIHNLAKKGRVNIQITQKDASGDITLRWEVPYNDRYGQPRQLAYKLDTIIINRHIEACGRPLPKILKLGSLREIVKALGFPTAHTNHLKHALLQNAFAAIMAQFRYIATDGTERTLEAGFTRHSVVFTGERLPDGTTADAVYLLLNEPYVPGPKARAEYAAFNARPRRRPARPAAIPQRAGQDAEPATPSPPADDALTTPAHALVQHFHQRFHGTPDVTPSAKALTQASSLVARYGMDQARHLVDFSVTAAHETDYRPQTFGGILQYTARARADYEHAQRRQDAAAREREERRRAQEEEHLRQQYEDYRATRLAALRATTPPDVLAAVEQAAAAHFERDNTNSFGRDLLRRYAIEAAVAAHVQLPSFAEWQAAQGQG